MNKVFKVIYNRTLQRYQVVSELAKNHGKSGSVSVGIGQRILASAIVAFLCGGVGTVYADPGSGAYSYQWGSSASATGDHAIALGPVANASGYTALAFGHKAQSSSTASVAIGQDTVASGEHSYALGWGANSSGISSMAIGSNSEATKTEATAVGAQAKAYGEYSFAMGWGAKANGDYATALGANSTSNSYASFGLGYSAVATGNYSYAIGWGAKTQAEASYAIGVNATASKDHAIAIGIGSHSDGAEAIAIGWGAKTTAATSYAIGNNATATHSGDIAFGNEAKIDAAAGADNISIGTSSKINKGTHNIALGYNAETTTDQGQGVAIGVNASQLKDNGVTIGPDAKGYAADGVSIGHNAESGVVAGTANNPVAIGNSSKARGTSSVSLGNDTQSNAKSAVAIGNAAWAQDVRTTAIGNNAHAEGAGSLAIGREASALTVTAAGELTTGTDAELDKKGVMAMGDDSMANGVNSIAFGNGAKVGELTREYGVGTDNQKVITNLTSVKRVDDAIAFGNLASAQSNSSTAIGTNAQALEEGTVALGANSVANRAATDALSTNASKIYKGTDATVATTFGANNAGAISVGNDGANGQPKVLRQITNLAAGAADSDAVNVAQLKAVANDERRLIANPTVGSGGKYKPNNGEVSLTVAKADGSDPTQVVLTDIASKTQQDANTTNITQLDTTVKKGLSFKGDDTTVINKKLGEQLDIKGGASAADLTEGNIGVVSDNGALKVKLNKNLNLGDDGSLTIGGKKYISSAGLNANNQKITNVANGDTRSDAVNYGQLQDAVNGATAKATTVKAKDANITVTPGTNAAGGKEYTVGLADKVTLGTGNNQVVVDGTTGNIQAGTVKIKGAGTVNELTNRTWNIDNPTIVNGQAATEDQLKTVSDGVKKNKDDITTINTTIGQGLNFGGDAGTDINKKLGEKLSIKGGVASDTDLVDDNIGVISDGTQLNIKLKKKLNLGADGSVTTGATTIDNTGLTIGGKSYITSAGLNANNQKITNVANGENRSDAVNYGQLQDAVNGAAAKATTVKAKDTNVTVTEGTNAAGGKEYTVGLGDKVTLGTDEAKQVTMDGTNGVIKAGTGDNAVELDGKTGTIKAGDKVTINGKTGVIKSGKVTVDGENGKVNGLTNITWNPDSITSGQAATEDQLQAVDKKITTSTDQLKKDGLNFAGNSGNAVHKDLGATMSIEGDGQKADDQYSGENIKTITEDGKLKIKMDKNLHVDGIGVGPAGANGKDAVSLNGKDGEGHIGLNGKDGSSADIHVKDGAPGVDGVDGITRIVYEDKNGKTNEVATTNDGMKFGGDFGDVSKMKLNSQVNVKGGASSAADLTEGNIGVVSDGQGNLNVKLNKNLSGLEKIEVKTVKADTVESKLIKTETLTAGNTTVNTNGLTIQNGPQITKDKVSAGGNKITEVAPGAVTPNSTDAVNGSQLYNATRGISQLGDKINRVGAGAAALAALHPLDFDPDAKWDVAVGYGNYANANAAAIGAYYRPNEDTMLSVGASLGGGENMVNAGVSVKLGAGNHVSTSKVAMAKEIKDMRKEIEGLKSALLDANAGRKIDTSKLQLFPDVPQNHWAYEYVSVLKGNGVIEGYPDGSFGGDRPMTRYEFATMLYRAMLNGAVLPEKLLKEFSPELERFTVDTVHADKNGNPTVERVRVKKA